MNKIIVVAAALIKDGKIFIAKRPAHKKPPLVWEFPGGKTETGETLQQALKRELKEELHIDTDIGEFISKTIHSYDFGDIELNLFKAKMINIQDTIIDTEHIETAWVSPQEFEQYQFAKADESFLPILKQISL